jgi:hypothetical protein
MRYPTLGPEKAPEVLDAVRRGATKSCRDCQWTGRGTSVDLHLFADIAEQLEGAKQTYPERLRRKDRRGGEFEAAACASLHQALPRDADMLGDYDFWTWLAVCQFRDLVEWRHGGEDKRAASDNFGIGKRDENLLYRMWARADIGYDPAARDRYALARRGDQDFWRSHVLRQGYGRCRVLARALIRFQFPDDSSTPTLRIPEIRELAKRLRRLNANLMFECLDDAGAAHLLEKEAEAAKVTIASETRG